MSWWRRLLRIIDQNRIRLPRRPLRPTDITVGDRLQIGLEIWRVKKAWTASAACGEGSFELVSRGAWKLTARLSVTVSPGGDHLRSWRLFTGGNQVEIPPEMIIAFPTGRPTERTRP